MKVTIKMFARYFFFFTLGLLLFAFNISCTEKSKAGSMPQVERIVSLSPSVTEILFAIGAGESVVGVTQYCDYPEEARERTIVGGFSGATISMEIIRSLEPDLVILSADMHYRIVSLLDDLGIASIAVEPRTFFEVYELIAILGEVTGCASGAEEVISGMQNTIAAVGEKIKDRPRPSVFWILAEEPLMSVGSETFISEAITLGGGRNIFDDVGEQWPLVSPEQVLVRKPDWIFAEEGSPGPSGSFWRNIDAVREGRVAFINADTLYRYGPRLTDAVTSIAKILHGDL